MRTHLGPGISVLISECPHLEIRLHVHEHVLIYKHITKQLNHYLILSGPKHFVTI